MPVDIERILELTAIWAKGYDNHMKWNEVAKLKSDMMRRMNRWRLVTTQQIREKCLALGMRPEDVDVICDIHARRLSGRRVVPQDGYRDFEFNHEALLDKDMEWEEETC